MNLERCPGCGGEFLPESGPVHAYMDSSPACWSAFGRILAAEYSNPQLLHVHRLSVDAFAAQHPGASSRQAIQSVGLHLARLYFQLECGAPAEKANAFMLRVAARKADLPQFDRPAAFAITTADVAPAAGGARHERMVRTWAETTWQAWRHVLDFIEKWSADSLQGL